VSDEGPAKPAGSAFIIATRNRADDLLATVESVVGQTRMPSELCIVDSSESAPMRTAIESRCADAGVKLDYYHPAPAGLTIQRNIGIDRTQGDPVFLIDDDVRLDPRCHEELLAEYARRGSEVGGVRPQMDGVKLPMRITHLYARLFGIGGWWPKNTGRVRTSMFAEFVSESNEPIPVECFPGSFMSYRREVFADERFDEALAGYAYKEDIDFSYRVSRRYVLLQTPAARYRHVMTPSQRMSVHQVQRMLVVNHAYLHRKLMPQTFGSRMALWWAILGVFILGIGKAVKDKDVGWMTGPVAGTALELKRSRRGSSRSQGPLPENPPNV
jgi:GT2 family glycosyltransferase